MDQEANRKSEGSGPADCKDDPRDGGPLGAFPHRDRDRRVRVLIGICARGCGTGAGVELGSRAGCYCSGPPPSIRGAVPRQKL